MPFLFSSPEPAPALPPPPPPPPAEPEKKAEQRTDIRQKRQAPKGRYPGATTLESPTTLLGD